MKSRVLYNTTVSYAEFLQWLDERRNESGLASVLVRNCRIIDTPPEINDLAMLENEILSLGLENTIITRNTFLHPKQG